MNTTKFTFDQNGMDALRTLLNQQLPEQKNEFLDQMQHHTRNCYIQAFELNNDQIALFSTMPDSYIELIGIQTRMMFQFGDKINFEFEVEDNIDPVNLSPKPGNVKYYIKGGGTFGNGHPKIKLEGGIKINISYPPKNKPK